MRVSEMPQEFVDASLQRSHALGDVVRELGPGVWLVSSASEPGRWYTASDRSCQCDGFKYRGRCRHMVRAAWETYYRAKLGRVVPSCAREVIPDVPATEGVSALSALT